MNLERNKESYKIATKMSSKQQVSSFLAILVVVVVAACIQVQAQPVSNYYDNDYEPEDYEARSNSNVAQQDSYARPAYGASSSANYGAPPTTMAAYGAGAGQAAQTNYGAGAAAKPDSRYAGASRPGMSQYDDDDDDDDDDDGKPQVASRSLNGYGGASGPQSGYYGGAAVGQSPSTGYGAAQGANSYASTGGNYASNSAQPSSGYGASQQASANNYGLPGNKYGAGNYYEGLQTTNKPGSGQSAGAYGAQQQTPSSYGGASQPAAGNFANPQPQASSYPPSSPSSYGSKSDTSHGYGPKISSTQAPGQVYPSYNIDEIGMGPKKVGQDLPTKSTKYTSKSEGKTGVRLHDLRISTVRKLKDVKPQLETLGKDMVKRIMHGGRKSSSRH